MAFPWHLNNSFSQNNIQSSPATARAKRNDIMFFPLEVKARVVCLVWGAECKKSSREKFVPAVSCHDVVGVCLTIIIIIISIPGSVIVNMREMREIENLNVGTL
jgi:hypothetical protein